MNASSSEIRFKLKASKFPFIGLREFLKAGVLSSRDSRGCTTASYLEVDVGRREQVADALLIELDRGVRVQDDI